MPLQEAGTRLCGERVKQTRQRGQDAEGCGVRACPKHGSGRLPGTPSSAREVRGGARAWLTAAAATGTRVEKV